MAYNPIQFIPLLSLWEKKNKSQIFKFIPNKKMFATDNPTRPIGHPPLNQGRVGEGFNRCVAFFFQIGVR
ncbi:hypothetical protein BZZ01_17770 [Nostocales cyanobacterium HT-58-2]|nr:hypothetical protein BZZ01_17770 [Nostocales cyanobacterium HT-58-2]